MPLPLSDDASLIEPRWLTAVAVNLIGMTGDHLPGAALSPTRLSAAAICRV
jgi:hypothetical protein